MDYWGWIPHLWKNLSGFVVPESIQDAILGENSHEPNKFGLHIFESTPEKYLTATFSFIKGSFIYDEESIVCSYSDETGVSHDIVITVYSDGVAKYRCPIDIDDDKLSSVICEIHYIVKECIHYDMYHSPHVLHVIDKTERKDEIVIPSADDALPPFAANSKFEAMVHIGFDFAYYLEDQLFDLASLTYDENSHKILGKVGHMMSRKLDLCEGYVVYGTNYLDNVLVETISSSESAQNDNSTDLGETIAEIRTALVNHSEIINNLKIRIEQGSSRTMNDNVVRLTYLTVGLTILSILVAYFAGSTLANLIQYSSLEELYTHGIGLIMAICLSIAAGYMVWLKVHNSVSNRDN